MSEFLSAIQKDLEKLLPTLKLNIQNEKLFISDFSLEGLNLEIDNRLIFRFFKVSNLNPKDVSLYLETQLDLSRVKNKYLKADSFYLYPNDSFYSNAKGVFEKRMWIVGTIRDAYQALEKLKQDLKIENPVNTLNPNNLNNTN